MLKKLLQIIGPAIVMAIIPALLGFLFTIRGRISEGTLKGHQRPTPGGLTWFVELPEESRPDVPATALARVEDSQELQSFQDVGLLELVDSLRRQIRSLTEQLTATDRQIEQLHVLVQQANLAGSRRSRWLFW